MHSPTCPGAMHQVAGCEMYSFTGAGTAITSAGPARPSDGAREKWSTKKAGATFTNTLRHTIAGKMITDVSLNLTQKSEKQTTFF